jgi:hypothetical protein
MEKTQPYATRPVLRWCSRLLDGKRAWGSVDLWPGRYGFRKYRLVVFPPGISPADRRLVRLWRGWPMWGAILWVLSEIVLGNMLSPGPAMVWSTTVYLASGAVTFALAGEVRARVRSLQVVLIDGYVDPHSAALYDEWKELVGILTEADHLLDQGKSSPVQHELVWWEAYERLGAATNAR